MQKILDLFKPNQTIDRPIWLGMVVFQVIVALIFWFMSKATWLPTPIEIWHSLQKLIKEEALIYELWTSTWLCLKAMLIAILISLIISYLTVLPFFRPIAFIISKFRFLTLVGLTFVFTLLTHSGHQLKVSLLVFGIAVFFVTSMVSVILSIPKTEFDHARTLRMSEWEVVWNVVILGQMDKVFEVIRQNFAISWMMLTMVEGISRAEGGIGTLLLNQNKHLHLDAVFAIQICIFLVGICMDYIIGFLKNLFCPYANLTLERK